MRTLELSIPSRHTEAFLEDIREVDPLTLRVQRGGSLIPPGDVVGLEITDGVLGRAMRIADRYGLGQADGIVLVSSSPSSIVTEHYATLTREVQSTTWEELELSIGSDSTMTPDRSVVMAFAGPSPGSASSPAPSTPSSARW